MNNIVKLSLFAFFAIGIFVALPSNTVFAWDGDAGAGCCGGGGSDGGYSPSPDPTPVSYPAQCVSFTASPKTLPQGGGDITLTWKTSGAYFVNISGVGSNLERNGSTVVHVTKTTTFTMTVVPQFHDQNVTCVVKVTVEPQTEKPAQCLFLNASKTVVHPDGETVTLTWETKDATSVSINNGVGTVSTNGSKNVFVNADKTFTLTAVGASGNDTCAVTITTKPVENKTPRCDYLHVSDNDVEEGDRVTLSWETTNADRVTISPNVGDVADDGSTTVTVNDDTTYTLRARNLDNGQEDTCTVTVRVDEDEDDDDDRRTPRCDLEVSKDKVKRGDRVTLSWETTHVDDVRIRDDRGNTIFDTDDYSKSDRKRYFDGSIDLIINQSTEFTLTAGGVDGGSKTCRVDVDVEDIAIYEKRDQGYVIALASVPYTGFEAGTFLTFLFYAILTLWALFVAYILVIKKSSIFGFSLYGQASMNETDLENRKKVEALVAKYAGTNSK